MAVPTLMRKNLLTIYLAHDYAGERCSWCMRQFVACIEESGFWVSCDWMCLLRCSDRPWIFTPYEGELLFQIATAPSIAAHAAEKDQAVK